MTRTMLIATVAALAITAPAPAQDRGERGKRGDQVQKSKAQRGGERAKAPQSRAQASERRSSERARAPQRERSVERQQRTPRIERQARRAVERQAPARVRVPARVRSVERQERVLRAPRVERRARQVENRTAASNRAIGRVARQAENRAERRAASQRVENRARTIRQREARQDRRAERSARVEQRVIDNRTVRPERLAAQRRDLWANLAQRRTARIDDDRSDRRAARHVATVGQRFDRDRYADHVPFVYRARYQDTPRYYYRYDDDAGYLYQVRRDNNFVSALFPLLGGAYSVGRPLPLSYSSYSLPYGYRSLYHDSPDHYYRYGGGAIYQVDSGTNLIQAIVALLAGQRFGVGQMLPASYNTYNVPYAYRDYYADTDDSWYRYNNGSIYHVDPRTRLIEDVYPMSYGGFHVGSMMPYGYADYNVPYGYQQVYYDTPDYNYRYYDGGIYQIDPATQIVRALVALVTGQNFNVGQQLPAQYGVYNVPYAYRDRYNDSADSWYRYNDGMIYQIDPGSRLIRDRYSIYT